MHAIFFARGPNIKSGLRLQPFQNVELFNLFAGLFYFLFHTYKFSKKILDLLRLNNDISNNGTLGLLDNVYNNMNINRKSSQIGLKPAA